MSWLLLRRRGLLWGVPARCVRAVRAAGGGVTVELEGAVLGAEAAGSTLARLEPRPLPRAAAARLGEPVSGIAMSGGEPVLIVDPSRPPRILLEVGDG